MSWTFSSNNSSISIGIGIHIHIRIWYLVLVVVHVGLVVFFCDWIAVHSVQSRSMDPTKDLGVYGYGSVAWKDRVESWKLRQDKNSMMMTEGNQHHLGGKGVDLDDNGGQGPDLPMYVFSPIFIDS
jgi:hypothetical protein